MTRKKKKQLSYYERFMAMTDEQRDREVAEFDREFVADTFGPLPPEAIEQHRRARRKARAKASQTNAARPKRGATNGRRVVVILERRLVARADAFAKANGTSRSRLIAEGLEAVIGKG